MGRTPGERNWPTVQTWQQDNARDGKKTKLRWTSTRVACYKGCLWQLLRQRVSSRLALRDEAELAATSDRCLISALPQLSCSELQAWEDFSSGENKRATTNLLILFFILFYSSLFFFKTLGPFFEAVSPGPGRVWPITVDNHGTWHT